MKSNQARTLPLRSAYLFGAVHGLEQEVSDIRNKVIKWNSSYTSSVRRGYIVALFEKLSIFEAFKAAYWTFGDTPPGETKCRRYLRIKAEYEDFLERH